MKIFLSLFFITITSLSSGCHQLSKLEMTQIAQLHYKNAPILTVPTSALPSKKEPNIKSSFTEKKTSLTTPKPEILAFRSVSTSQVKPSILEQKQPALEKSALYAFSKAELNDALFTTPQFFNFKPYTPPKPTLKQEIQGKEKTVNKSKKTVPKAEKIANKAKVKEIAPKAEKKKSVSKQTEKEVKPTPKSEKSDIITQVTYESCQNEQTDLWCRIRMGYQFQVEDNEAIQEAVAYFAEAQTFFDRVASRARPYLYYVVREIEAQKLPLELALLPVVESAYRTTAVSPKAAAGLWQFIPSTGEQFGLTQNEWYDARYDVVASTRAALKYLKRLHKRFNGDWFLALAAYNWGQGNISKAIEKNTAEGKPTDFWSLELPTETRQYVPRLIAVAEIIAHPKDYGIHLKSIASRPYFKQVEIDQPIRLDVAAELAGMSVEDFKYYNSTHLQDTTNLIGSQRFTLPISHADQFKKNVAGLPATELMPTPIVEKEVESDASADENTAEEPTKTDTSTLETLASNEGETDIDEEGTAINEEDEVTSKKVVSVKDVFQLSADKSVEVTHYYRVKSGDTLWHIAKRHNMKLSKLQQLNGFDGRHLKVGQKIKIGGSLKQPVKTVKAFLLPKQRPAKIQPHLVQKKETLWQIAKRYETTVPLLRALNNLQGQSLKVGSTLKIPVATPEAEETLVAENEESPVDETSEDKDEAKEQANEVSTDSATEKTTKKKIIHTVKSGESLWLIARYYQVHIDELMEWNSLQKRDALRSGQKITVWQDG